MLNILQKIGDFIIPNEDSSGRGEVSLICLAIASIFLLIVTASALILSIAHGTMEILTNPASLSFMPWVFLLIVFFSYPSTLKWIDYATYNRFTLHERYVKEDEGRIKCLDSLIGLWGIYAVSTVLYWLWVFIPAITISGVIILGLVIGGTLLSRKTFQLADNLDTHKSDPDAHKEK